MWILSFLPDFVFHLITLVGILGVVASFFFGFIPFVSTYKLPIQVASVILLVVGIYFEGGIANEDKWKQRVAEAEKKVLEIQVQSAEANTKLVDKIKENEKLRKERQNATQTIITQVVKQTDSQCTLSNGFVRVHDSASQDKIPDSTRSTDGTTSNVKPSEFLTTVTNNYATCYDIREKLIGWQEWYKTQKELFEK